MKTCEKRGRQDFGDRVNKDTLLTTGKTKVENEI